MRARLRPALFFAAVATTGLFSAEASAASCAAIIRSFPAAAGGLKVEFIRPVVVSRGQGDGSDVFDLVTDRKIDGQLRCKDDRFLRFNARIPASADQNLRDAFYRIEQAALVVIVRWSASKASKVIHGMTADAAEYLRASIERGDVDIAGKVEEHAGADGDVGLIWTPSEREFIVAAAE